MGSEWKLVRGPAKAKDIKWHCLEHDHALDCAQECSLRKALVILSKKYSLLILRSLLLNGKNRFNEILDEIKCSPKTLSARLKELERNGIIQRKVVNEMPVKVEYSLTTSGDNLENLFEFLSNWAKEWLA